MTPLLQAADRAFPETHLALLSDGEFSDLLTGLPGVDEVLLLKESSLTRHPLKLRRLLRRLKDRTFDLAIDAGAEGSDSAFLTYASRAPFRVGYRHGESDLFVNIQVPSSDPDQHEVDVHLDLLRHLVGEVPDVPMRVFPSEEDRSFASKYLAIKYVEQNDLVLGIHPDGPAEKRWPLGRFSELADRLIETYGAKIALFGESEISISSQENVVPIEPMSLRRTAALIEQCHCFLTGNTGLMHLAVAVDTPTIAIFLTDKYRRYGPQGEQHRIVYSKGGDVKVDTVLRVFRELMEWMAEDEEEPSS